MKKIFYSLSDIVDKKRIIENSLSRLSIDDDRLLEHEFIDINGDFIILYKINGDYQKGVPYIIVNLDLTLSIICQRCLMPFKYNYIDVEKIFIVKDDKSLSQLELIFDNNINAIINNKDEFDVLDLIVDQILLSLPISPKHDNCINSYL